MVLPGCCSCTCCRAPPRAQSQDPFFPIAVFVEGGEFALSEVLVEEALSPTRLDNLTVGGVLFRGLDPNYNQDAPTEQPAWCVCLFVRSIVRSFVRSFVGSFGRE